MDDELAREIVEGLEEFTQLIRSGAKIKSTRVTRCTCVVVDGLLPIKDCGVCEGIGFVRETVWLTPAALVDK